ncbi:MAG: RNA-binding protein [Euryarchaeota archaeon]|jgi:DNA-binding protein Alba|nr:RNA-binding protein [Euryarchaeota archaeon]
MTERRSIFIGKKPLHAYVRAVVMAMEKGERQLQLVARGATIGRAVDIAEICRRRNGIIAQGLPETVNIGEILCSSEVFTNEGQKDRTVSVLTIELDGIGDVPTEEE